MLAVGFGQCLEYPSDFNDTNALAYAVAEAKDFPELAAASALLARLRQRVRHCT